MKSSVIFDELHELNLRPKDVYARYLQLFEEEVKRTFPVETLHSVSQCPACESANAGIAFSKWGFSYARCQPCGTLYMNPAPSTENLQRFYRISKAWQYWTTDVLPATSKERREHLSRARLDWVLSFLDLESGQKLAFLDYGTRDPAFWTEVAQAKSFEPRYAFEPMMSSSSQGTAGFEVLSALPEESAGIATAFEVIETAVHPERVLRQIHRSLSSKGFLFLTTRAGSGFDMQLLGAHAPNLLPLHHVTLLSLEGMTALLDRIGFDILELSTPGQLDVEVVVNSLKSDPDIHLPRFFDDLIRKRKEPVHQAFQEFLQRAQLSSHMRVAVRKR